MPGTTEILVLLVLAVLLFGQNLPDVARTWGSKFADFKRGIRKIEDEIRSVTRDVTSDSPSRARIAEPKHQENPYDRDESTAPKFEPPPE